MPEHSGDAITIGKITPREDSGLVVTSSAFDLDGAIPRTFAAEGGNISPPLEWEMVENAGSYALIVEDPDAPREHPFVHWMIWNLPGGDSALPQGVPISAHPVSPQAVQGRNGMGANGYMGPKPPPGHGLHHYHFQLFALDGPLEMDPDSDLQALTDAMKGRVIRCGELVGTFETPGPTP